MKFNFIILIGLLFSFSLVKPKTDLQRKNLKGKVKSVTEKGYSGSISRIRSHSLSISKYDENGNLTEQLYLTGDSVLMRTSHFIRNAVGRIIEEKVISAKGEVEDKHTFKYDLNGNCTEQCVFTADGDKITCFYNTIDKKGLIIAKKRGHPNKPSYTLTYQYDSLSNMILMTRLHVETKKLETATYSYQKFDDQNNWTQQTSHFEGDNSNTYTIRRIEYY